MGPDTSSKPRVLLLHNFLTPYRIPLFSELARRFDLEVWILGDVRRIRDWPSEAPEGSFRYRNLPRIEIPLGSRYNVLMLNYSLPWALACQRADAIICCGWDSPALVYAALHARLTRTPFVLWSGSTPVERSTIRTLSLPAVKGLVRLANAWVAYGSRAKDYLVQLGADAERAFRAFNTVELEFFAQGARISEVERLDLRERLGIRTRHVVLYCGNLLELKGLGDLMPAFAEFGRERSDVRKCCDVTLLLVGSGNDEQRYREFCKSEGVADKVVFAGFVDRKNLPPYYALADLLVLPSRSEVWGLVINEAMACGVPVLTTDVVGAVPDLLRDGVNGFVVPVRNTAALCGALRRFFVEGDEGGAMRAAMSEAARQTIQPFTCAAMADAFEAAVRCAMERR